MNGSPPEPGHFSRILSEEDAFRQMSAIDQLRAPSPRVGPDQAAANQQQNLRDLLSIIPGPGNVIAAEDASQSFGDAAGALGEGRYGRAALHGGLGALSAFGAVTGLPAGRMAGNAAKGASSRTNIFAGPMAQTADHAALAKAQEMAEAGVRRDAIHAQTGWFQGVDGKWRFEIDDSGAKLADENYIGGGVTTFEGLDHPGLTAAYGKTAPVAGFYEPGKSGRGSYTGASGDNLVHIEAQGGNASEARSITLHEVQHDVQAKEGTAPGGTASQMANIWGPEAWRVRVPMETKLVAEDLGLAGKPIYSGTPEYDRLKEAVRQSIEDKSGQPFKFRYRSDGMDEFDWDFGSTMRAPKEEIGQRTMLGLQALGDDKYHRLAGEVEARNVQSRMNMTAAERRAKAPWLTQDVPDDRQIVRGR
jgi:hypothetical protein